MKRSILTLVLLLTALSFQSCDIFKALHGNRLKTAQGAPYELITVCEQQEWNSPLGDTLRSVLTAPVPYINQTEPLFDLLRVRANDYKGMIADHRNILEVATDPKYTQAEAQVTYNRTAEPQVIVTLTGPDIAALTRYVSDHRENIVALFNGEERKRALDFAKAFGCPQVEKAMQSVFGVKISVPKSYILAAQSDDFVWARNEYPTASQGFIAYSYPYTGREMLSREALAHARKQFAMRVPGPSTGSFMTTSDVIDPEYTILRINDRVWCELRGFWDVDGDFMGGPFVSYTTVDTRRNRVFTIDCYVYSPKLHKRNFLRGVEHLVHSVEFPEETAK